jgi:hypothetical protein
MADFAASLVNPTTSDVGLSSDGTNITISDYSNYIANTESGHLVTDFQYKKLTVTCPDATTYIFGTTLITTKDESINYPSIYVDPLLYPPIDTLYAYTTGDGVYEVELITVPTWSIKGFFTTGDCVYHSGTLYIATQNSNNKEPNTEKNYWSAITESGLSTKYIATERLAVVCDLNECYADLVTQASCSNNNVICQDATLCEDNYFVKAMRMSLILDAIDELAENESWNEVTVLINSGSAICDCCN